LPKTAALEQVNRKDKHMRVFRIFGGGLALAIALVGANPVVLAQEPDHPLASTTAQWWQYATSILTGVNPLMDPNRTNCMVGQRDPAWFLSGVFPAAQHAGNALFLAANGCSSP
jgi:hypothetical protein